MNLICKGTDDLFIKHMLWVGWVNMHFVKGLQPSKITERRNIYIVLIHNICVGILLCCNPILCKWNKPDKHLLWNKLSTRSKRLIGLRHEWQVSIIAHYNGSFIHKPSHNLFTHSRNECILVIQAVRMADWAMIAATIQQMRKLQKMADFFCLLAI